MHKHNVSVFFSHKITNSRSAVTEFTEGLYSNNEIASPLQFLYTSHGGGGRWRNKKFSTTILVFARLEVSRERSQLTSEAASDNSSHVTCSCQSKFQMLQWMTDWWWARNQATWSWGVQSDIRSGLKKVDPDAVTHGGDRCSTDRQTHTRARKGEALLLSLANMITLLLF